MTISKAREAAQEIFGKHQRHEVTFDLSASDDYNLKRGSRSDQGNKSPERFKAV
jgi:hypothetical protein